MRGLRYGGGTVSYTHLDYIVFNFSIALRTFFQKIAEPQDIAPTMAVAQTINPFSYTHLSPTRRACSIPKT